MVARVSALFVTAAFLLSMLLLTGCVGTSYVDSKILVAPTQPVLNLRVVYVENTLMSKGYGPSGSLSQENIGYNNLAALLRERVPIVFSMNGISADYATIQSFKLYDTIDNIRWSSGSNIFPLLEIQFVGGQINRGAYDLNLLVDLLHASTKKPQWTGSFRITVAKNAAFNDGLVDEMLKSILEQLAKDGFISLQNGKAIIPLAKK